MSDETPATDASDDDLPGPFSDLLLNAFAAAAQGTPTFELSITIAAPGAVVSGTMINHRVWWDGVIERSGPLGDSFATIRDGLLGDEGAVVPDDDEDSPMVNFIHMRDAKIASDTGGYPANGMFWRAKIQDISGWTFGAFAPPKDS